MNTRESFGNIMVLGVAIVMAVALCPACAEAKNSICVDSLGRRIEIPSSVNRIACMYAFTGHVVAMLGHAEKIVAVSNGLKRDVLLTTMFPHIREAAVPKFQGAINIEELTAAKPDIVFLHSQTGRNPAMAAKLTACGLTWIAVNFNSMRAQRDVIALIGAVIGASSEAQAYNTYYQRCIDRVATGISAIPIAKRPRVYHATVEPTRTSPKDSLPADWMNAAGLIHVAANDPAGILNENHQVGIEQILIWNPDVILTNEPGVAAAIKRRTKWKAVAAVKNARVHQLPIGISRWGHPGSLETPLAILWAAKTIYPKQFVQIDMTHELKHFYATFFNYNLSNKIVKNVLSGHGMRLNKSRRRVL